MSSTVSTRVSISNQNEAKYFELKNMGCYFTKIRD